MFFDPILSCKEMYPKEMMINTKIYVHENTLEHYL